MKLAELIQAIRVENAYLYDRNATVTLKGEQWRVVLDALEKVQRWEQAPKKGPSW